MFERYTESARRALFFARYETSQSGSTSIEPEHILLGLTRESAGIVRTILRDAGVTTDEIRADLERAIRSQPKLPTSVEIPFSEAVKHVLQFAAQEADAFTHSYIGSEHLLLALLREEKTVAWEVLTTRGLSLTQARNRVAELLTLEGPERSKKTTLIRDEARMRAASRINEIRLALTLLGSLDSPPPEAVVGAVRQLLDLLDALERDLDL
jgi:ATP-dependent Clp protease ATP-binding subunit ClpC